MRVLMLALACLAAAQAPAAACDLSEYPSRFTMFDRADAVVLAKPTAVPKLHHAGDVTLAVVDVLRGKAANTIRIHVDGTDCDPAFRAGAPTIVFLKDGRVDQEYRGAIGVGREPYLARLQQWSAARGDAARAGVIAAAIGDGGEVAIDGVVTLVDHAELVAALTADHVAAIARAWPKLHGGLRGMLRELKHPELRAALAKADRDERARRRQRPKTRPM